MESEGITTLINFTILLTALGATFYIILNYVIKSVKTERKQVDKPQKNENTEHTEKKEINFSKNKKKVTAGCRYTGRYEKSTFAQSWLLTTMKSHTSQVLDMDFSSGTKYSSIYKEEDGYPKEELKLFAICSKIDFNGNKNIATLSAKEIPRVQRLSRRQRKNRRREDGSPPDNPIIKAKKVEKIKLNILKPLAQFAKLNLAEPDLHNLLYSYRLSPEQMLTWGYPVESNETPGQAIIFKSTSDSVTSAYTDHHKHKVTQTKFDVNAQEFVPGNDYSDIKAEWNANYDSGQGSGSSSTCGDDSEESSSSSSGAEHESITENKLVAKVKSYSEAISGKKVIPHFLAECGVTELREHKCTRCSKNFFINNSSEYLTKEQCYYHWGKFGLPNKYSCCKGGLGSVGCTINKLHVWGGLKAGLNGPFDNFVRTRPRKTLPPDGNFGIYAIDCEMCYTVLGLELTKVTVIGADGRLVYDTFVKPQHEIIDYNTRFSGITAKDLNNKNVTKTLRQVQNDLMGFINADSFIIGHGAENDLRALKILHRNVVDTAVSFPHYKGLPYRRSLKSLTSCLLKREIQCSSNGHNSIEDAQACMELVLWKVRKDFKDILNYQV